MRKVIIILEKMLCLIVGREGRRERRWWASSYQVSPNIVSCVLTHIFTPTHLHTHTSPHLLISTHVFIPTAHPHTYTSSHTHTSPHPLSMNLYFLTGDMEVSFVGSFGLTVHSLILIADTTSGKKVELSLIDHDEEADMLQVLYLLDHRYFRQVQLNAHVEWWVGQRKIQVIYRLAMILMSAFPRTPFISHLEPDKGII